MTSSISAGFTFGFRSRSAWMTAAERVSARTFRNMPPLERPIGVRTASTTTASLIGSLSGVEGLPLPGEIEQLGGRFVELAEGRVLPGGGGEGRGADRVGPAEDASPERREAEAVEESEVH